MRTKATLITVLIITIGNVIAQDFAPQDDFLRDALPSRAKVYATIEGKPIPDSAWPTKWTSSNPISLASLKKSPVLFLTFNEWLPECKQACEVATKLLAEFSQHDLKVLGVHGSVIDGRPENLGDAIAIGIDDGDKLRRYLNADADPNFYLIDREGNLAYADISMLSIRSAVIALINANSISKTPVAARDESSQSLPADLQTWGIYPTQIRSKMVLQWAQGNQDAEGHVMLDAPPVGEQSKFIQHDIVAFDIDENRLTLHAKNTSHGYSERVLSAFIDQKQGLGVGRLVEMGGKRHSRVAESLVLLETVSEEIAKTHRLEHWLSHPYVDDLRVVSWGRGSKLPKAYGWLFDPNPNVNRNAAREFNISQYKDMPWPPKNDLSQQNQWKSVNDSQGNKLIIDLSQARGISGGPPPPIFVPDKLTLLMASSHASAKILQPSDSEQKKLLEIYSRYQDYLHLVTYFGGKAAEKFVPTRVPERYHETVILDPGNSLLETHNLQNYGGTASFFLSTDGVVRWLGDLRQRDSNGAGGQPLAHLMQILYADPVVQTKYFGKILSAQENISPLFELKESLAEQLLAGEPQHPFEEYFGIGHTVELNLRANNATYRVLIDVDDRIRNEFQGNARVYVKLDRNHPLTGYMAKNGNSYQRRVVGQFDLGQYTVDIQWVGEGSPSQVSKLVFNGPIRMRLDLSSKTLKGSDRVATCEARSFEIPQLLEKFEFDGTTWRKKK